MVDYRETDRLRREHEPNLQRGTPARSPPDAGYNAWHESAWVGHHPAPPAEDRYYGENAGYQAEDRRRNEAWYPSFEQSNLTGRQRTRTPNPRYNPRPNRGGPGPIPGTWGFVPADNRDDAGWDEQNMRSQQRRNVEHHLNLDAMD